MSANVSKVVPGEAEFGDGDDIDLGLLCCKSHKIGADVVDGLFKIPISPRVSQERSDSLMTHDTL